MRKKLVQFCFLLLALALLSLAFQSVQLARASWKQSQALRLMNEDSAHISMNDQLLQKKNAQKLLKDALKMSPRDASLLEDFARSSLHLSQLQFEQGYPCGQNKQAHQALIALRQAQARRPNWPYVHISLAQVKAHCGDFDAEFERALIISLDLGANEIRIDRAIALLWLRHGDQNPILKQYGPDATLRAIERDPSTWIDQAVFAGRAREVCQKVKSNQALSRCRELGWGQK